MRFDYLPPITARAPYPRRGNRAVLSEDFRQRWYVTGRKRRRKSSEDLRPGPCVSARWNILPQRPSRPDPSFDAEEYVRYLFGIVSSKGEPRRIALRTDSRQAKYFRALPLHHTQEEAVHDAYSIFYYKMKITDDLVSELLSYGARIEVLEPPGTARTPPLRPHGSLETLHVVARPPRFQETTSLLCAFTQQARKSLNHNI